MLEISDQIVGQRVRAVPVGDERCLPNMEFLGRSTSGRGEQSNPETMQVAERSFRFFRKMVRPRKRGATQHLFDNFHEFSIPQNSNPITALYALDNINNQMEEKGMGRIPDTVLHACFVRALPAEYDHARETLQSMKNRDRDEIIRVVSTRYFNLPQKKGAQRSSRPPEHAIFASKSVGRSGPRQGRGRNRGGGRGSSRGGNSSCGGSHSSSSIASRNTGGSQGSSRGNNGTSSSGGGSDEGSCDTPPGRCWRCRRRGNKREESTTKESDFVPRCARCSGLGHEESACPSDATILAMKLPDEDSEEENVFVANATGKCSLRIGEEVGDGELDKQVAHYIADSGATCHMTPDANGFTNNRECSQPLGLADKRKISIAGYGGLTVAFRFNDSWVPVKLDDVAHVPLLSYNLVSITSLAQEGHPSAVEKSGVTPKHQGGGTVQFPLIGKLCRQYGYRPEAKGRMVDTACPVIAPGQAKATTTPTYIIFSTALTATPTRHYSRKRRSSKESASAGSFTSAGDAQWQRDYGSLLPG